MLSKRFRASGMISTGEAARRMGVHRSTVWHWISTGALRAEKTGGVLAIKPADLDRFRAMYSVGSEQTADTTAKERQKE